MKKIYLLLLFVSFLNFDLPAQEIEAPAYVCGRLEFNEQPVKKCTLKEHDINGSHNSIFEVKDDFGNRYCERQLEIPSGAQARVLTTNGIFNVFFSGSSNGSSLTNEEQLVLQVFNDISEVIIPQLDPCNTTYSPVWININFVDGSTLNAGGNAVATSYTNINEHEGEKYTNRVWNKINGRIKSGSTVGFDGAIKFNNDRSWYLGNGTIGQGTDADADGFYDNLAANEFDLYTTALHEILHLLGFRSNISPNTQDNFTLYDAYLTSGTPSVPMLNVDATNTYNFNAPISDINSGCNNVLFDAVSPTNSGVLAAGTTLSHFYDCNTTDRFIMNPTNGPTEYKRITQAELDVLIRIGYNIGNISNTNSLANGDTSNVTVANLNGSHGLVARDDGFGLACQTQYVYGIGNPPLTIPFSDIIQNDVNTANSLPQNFFNETDPSTTIVVNTNSFDFSSSVLGINKIRYELRDTNGNISNVAIINVWVTNGLGVFNVPVLDNTNCNLITNYGFNNTDCSNRSCTGIIDPGPQACSGGYSAVEGWYPMMGTADLMLDDGTCTNYGNRINPNWHLDFPASFLYLADYNNNEEAMMTAVNVQAGSSYILSYDVTRASPDWTSAGFEVGIVESQIDIPDFGVPDNNVLYENYVASGFTNNTVINNSVTSVTTWRQDVVSFTASSDNEFLYFFAYTDQGPINLDNVEMIEDLMPNSDQVINFDCSSSMTLGDVLCTIKGMEYVWFEGSTQLTESDGFGNYSLLQTTDNSGQPIDLLDPLIGSQLLVSPSNTATFTLVRRFIGKAAIDPITLSPITDGTIVDPITGNWVVDSNINDPISIINKQVNYEIVSNCMISCVGTTTWDGSSWDNGDPDIDTEVILNGDYDTATDNSFSACSLTVNDGFSLQIDALDFVEVKYNTTIHGDLLVKHTGSFVQKENFGFFQLQGAGNATVEKMTAESESNTEITYFCMPMKDVTVGEIFSINPFFNGYRYYYNTANYQDSCYEIDNDNTCIPVTDPSQYDGVDDNGDDWVFASNDFVMEPGVGLIVRPNTNSSVLVSFSGELNTGEIHVPITRNDGEIGDSNPIITGNPYASAIDVDAFFKRNVTNHPSGSNTDGILDGIIYIWSAGSPPTSSTNGNQPLNYDTIDFATINLAGAIAGGDLVTPNGFIPSAQGVYANYSDDAPLPNGNIVYENSMRVTEDNNQFFRTSNNLDNKIWLSLSAETGVRGQILLSYVPYATDGDDGSAFDARIETPEGQNALLYFRIPESDKKFSIQGKAPNSIDVNEVVSIGFFNSIEEASTLVFTMKIDDFQGAFFDNQTVYVRDNLSGDCHNLSDSNYEFTSAMGEFNDRFDLVFSTCETLSVTENELEEVQVFPNPTTGIVHVKTTTPIKSLTLFNNLGQLILSKADVNSLNLSSVSEGLYFLKIKDINGNSKNVRVIKRGN